MAASDRILRFVHAADLHLDSPMRGLERYEGAPAHELRNATRQALEKLVTYCLETQVDFLIIAGDIFDGDWRDFSTGLFFRNQLSRLAAANIPAFLLHGNHDAASQITHHLQLPKNCHTFSHARPETHLLEDLGVALHGQSFPQRKETRNLALQYPEAVPGMLNIGVLHTALEGRPGHGTYAPCTEQDLQRKHYQYWALGHVHRTEIFPNRDPWIVFPGNLQGRHARETGPKGAMLVQAQGNQITQAEHLTFDVVRWHHAHLLTQNIRPGRTLRDEIQNILRDCTQDPSPQAPELHAVRLTVHLSNQTFERTAPERTAPETQIDHRLLEQEIRALTYDLPQPTWLEKIVWSHPAETQLNQKEDSPLDNPEATSLHALKGHLQAIQNDPQVHTQWLQSLQPLQKKLPLEVLQSADMPWQPRESNIRKSDIDPSDISPSDIHPGDSPLDSILVEAELELQRRMSARGTKP